MFLPERKSFLFWIPINESVGLLGSGYSPIYYSSLKEAKEAIERFKNDREEEIVFTDES